MPRPPRPTRREFHQTSAAIVATGARGWRSGRAAARPALVVPPFERPLPIPPVLAPAQADSTTDYYDLVQRAGRATLLTGIETPVWGYDGLWPGPTIRALP